MLIRPPLVLVIASVLKPVDDVRMYKKFAKSLDRTGKYVVNIVGFAPQILPADASVRFFPLFRFPRLHWRRLLANYFFYRTLKKLAPQLLVLTTPELYPAVWWYRKRHRVLLVYDMVENYGRNVQYNQGFASWVVYPLTRMLGYIERRLRQESSLLLSAEQGYLRELGLASSQVVVVENKALRPQPEVDSVSPKRSPLSIIYTGTVSEVYGIWQSCRVIELLVKQEKMPITFTILGHVPQSSIHQQLREYAQQHSWVDLQTSDCPVPHDKILALIRQANFGIVSHQPVPSIAHCFPTRIWEYMACQLPFLLQNHPYWTDYCKPYNCAIALDFNNPSIRELKQKLVTDSFYTQGVPDAIYWQAEEKKLLPAVEQLTINR